MISEKYYYGLLYNKLFVEDGSLFKKYHAHKHKGLKETNRKYKWIYDLLDCVEDKYDFNMQKMIQPNYNKFLCWQRCFVGRIDNELISVAMQFVLFCCLVDKILDSKRFSKTQKNIIINKIDILNLISDLEYIDEEFQELDVFINNIRRFIVSIEDTYSDEKNAVLRSINKAFLSEIYMSTFPLLPFETMEQKNVHLLTDKSIEFELAAFLIASFGANNNQTKKAALEVANIFCLIDDLCDFIEDIKARRKNSLLFLYSHDEEEIGLSKRVEMTVENLDYYIIKLKDNVDLLRDDVDEKFFEYVINEVWEWCSGIRRICQ